MQNSRRHDPGSVDDLATPRRPGTFQLHPANANVPSLTRSCKNGMDFGVSENRVPLNPMLNDAFNDHYHYQMDTIGGMPGIPCCSL